ncbi:MAG: NUDIX hydrolase [Hyphomonas sp.]|uniref:NUDIX domain-containing protein n=1 Tax=Hyphomonas sp. TaxID=87 RepID=UPI003528EAA8
MTDQLSNGYISPHFHLEVPDGDEKLRRVCAHCRFIDYVNPKIVAGSVVTKGDRILLCRRAIEPRKGYWTLPAGFMEEDETVEEAARREAREEACAEIRIGQLLAVYSVPRIAQVQVMFRAHLESDFAAGPESLEVDLFDWKDIPWSELAFPTVVWALTQFSEIRNEVAFAPFTNPPATERLTR